MGFVARTLLIPLGGYGKASKRTPQRTIPNAERTINALRRYELSNTRSNEAKTRNRKVKERAMMLFFNASQLKKVDFL